jgi:hypothetical protein
MVYALLLGNIFAVDRQAPTSAAKLWNGAAWIDHFLTSAEVLTYQGTLIVDATVADSGQLVVDPDLHRPPAAPRWLT